MSFLHRDRICGWFRLSCLLKVFRALPSCFSIAGRARSLVIHSLSCARGLLPPFVAAVLVAVPILAPPMSWQPRAGDAGAILGTLLTAQAAIAALTLAVTLFMMQGLSARRDVDDRMYREYVWRSWVRNILWGSLLAVGVTGILLLIERSKPELQNLVLAAGFAFFVNLVLAGALFERAVHLSRPEQWQALRHDVNKRDVQKAVQAFLGRRQRVAASKEANELDVAMWFPDPSESSADEAIRALLGDARRAMSERRLEELSRSLDSVRELVKYAMNGIKTTGIQWSAPGSRPGWPPLMGLSRNLYSFREDVIREGDREYILELLRFDYMLTIEGMRERCGELFTVGLDGYRRNYQIANRIATGEFREMLRDRFSLNVDSIIFGVEPVEAFPYVREMVRHQEWLLSDSMHSNQPRDYDQLHRSFQAWIDAIRLFWETDNWPPSEASSLIQQLKQEYRVALMGLAGRALFLAQSNRITDVNSYIDVTRLAYSHLEPMADDLAHALSHDDWQGSSLWQEWETEDALPYQTIGISTERYLMLFFALRLMELSSDTMPTFDLHGRAQRALDWFINNSESIEAYVRAELVPTLEQRREFATESLRSAVRRDGLAEDYEVIGLELNATRVSTLNSEVYAAAFSENSVERLFERAGVSLHLSGDAADAPEERVIMQLVHKGFFTDTPEGALAHYAPLRGEHWGRALSHDALRRFCEALEGAPDMVAPLESPVALLQGIDRAIEDLNASGDVAVVLAGDWFDIQVGLGTENPEGYKEQWMLPESDRMGEIGRYRGYPILSARNYEDRCVYVVELAGWGHFVRAKTDEDQDLRVEIRPISIDRARELLTANPAHFASQPDEESKLRKLQTHVEIVIGDRTGFRVTDTSRARRVLPIHDEHQ